MTKYYENKLNIMTTTSLYIVYMGISLEVGQVHVSPSCLGYCVQGGTIHWKIEVWSLGLYFLLVNACKIVMKH